MVSAVNLDVPGFINREIAKSRAAIDAIDTPFFSQILADIASTVVETLRARGKIMFCGNGGSAADSASRRRTSGTAKLQPSTSGRTSIDGRQLCTDGHRQRLWVRQCLR